MRSRKTGTVALVIRRAGGNPQLIERFSDDQEIAVLESALDSGSGRPLDIVYGLRERQKREDEEFGDYVEGLLSKPFVKPEIQEHGLQWLRSKIKIEDFQRSEAEATRTIADYAFQLYCENPDRVDFYLAGPVAKVRIRVFVLGENTSVAA